MIHKLLIHCSIILTVCLLSYEFNIYQIKIEAYQSFLIILALFHLLVKIEYVKSEKTFLKNGIILHFRF